MWKAEVYEITKKEDGSSEVSVKYVNDDKVFYFTHNISSGGLNTLKNLVRSKIKILETQFLTNNDIELGEINLTIEPEVVISKTVEQLKKEDYQNKLEELQKKKRFVDLGVLEQKDIILLQSEVKNLATELGEI